MKIKSFQWGIYVVLVVGYLFYVHKLNGFHNKPIVINSESLVSKNERDFQTKLAGISTDQNTKILRSYNADIPNFRINYPATWSATLADPIVLKPLQEKSSGCIKIYQSIDHLPILEAKNFNKYMFEKPNLQYVTKEEAEMYVDHMPSIVSNLRQSGENLELYVHNAIIVKDNTYTYVLRGCANTDEGIFLGVYKSFATKK